MTTESRRAAIWATAIHVVAIALIAVPAAISRGTEYFQMPLASQISIGLGALLMAPGAAAFLLLFVMLGAFYVPESVFLVSLMCVGFFYANWTLYFRVARRIIRGRAASNSR
jgi:hypothetical protein